MKEVIAFDLDGTLAESKSRADRDVIFWIRKLVQEYKVAIITGGTFDQIQRQFLSELDDWCRNDDPLLKQFYLLPTSGAILYEHQFYKSWKQIYQNYLSPDEVSKIYAAFYRAIVKTSFPMPQIYGNHIENRKTQITFSALGQEAPVELKEKWDPGKQKRQAIIKELQGELEEFEIRYGGTTSIDVTHKGIDKAFGMNKLMEHLSIDKSDVLFIGDALREGGNDYPVKAMGIECIAVSSIEDTVKVIKKLYMSS
ncbi:MAG: HAD-IIB family hydrolase [Candidatus Dadabacteria bacterium]|nr:HAD-IIB family hydrolase [Candidatus Dadabacteria bacterium]